MTANDPKRTSLGLGRTASISSFNNLQNGLLQMAREPKKTKDDYDVLAESIGMAWVGETLPANTTIRTEWICKEGHLATKSFKKMRLFPKCRRCAGFDLESEDYLAMATKLNYEWLGPLPKRATYNTNWLCDRHHKLFKSYANVKRRGCKKCASEDSRHTADEYIRLAKESDFTWLGPLPTSTKTKTYWRCPRKHKFDARYNDIQQGYGCTKCNVHGTSRVELRVYAELRTIFDDVKWRHKESNQECDIFLPAASIAIEIDGYWWHRKSLTKDKNKNRVLSDVGIQVFRLRELPLEKLEGHDVCYKFRSPHLPIIQTLLRSILSDNPSLAEAPVIQNYLQSKKFRDDAAYRKFITMLPSPPPEFSLAALHPSIAAEWDYGANDPLKPEMFLPGADKEVEWICKRKGHPSFPQLIYLRTGAQKQGCPYCSGKKVAPGESFADRFPDIAAEWYGPMNRKGPDEYAPYSGIKVWWQKKECGHPPWDMAIQNRTSQGQGCSYCSGRRVAPGESFADHYPNLAREWHPTRNELSAKDYSPMSAVEVWWQCRKGHEWEKMINQRAIRQSPCKICAEEAEKTCRAALAKKVAELIRAGKTNVKAAEILNTSATTVSGLRSLARKLKYLD